MKIYILLILVLFVLAGCASKVNKFTEATFGFDIEETNPENCVGIKDSDKRDMCYNVVVTNTNNPELCGKIIRTQFRDTCYSGVANSLDNSSYCENIESSGFKSLCYQNFNRSQ